MSMTTPRVTAPVELVREKIAKLIDPEAFVPMEDVIGMRKALVLADKIIAHTGYDGINWKAEWEDACSLRIAERDTLSAAPAPEGGAVDWQPIETALQNGTKIDLWGHWPGHDRWARTPDAVWDEERCDWKVNGFYAGQYAHPPRFTHWRAISGPAALATREEAPAEAGERCEKCGAGPAGNCGYYDCETPRNTCPLRAQPPASEDAQPVATVGENAETGNGRLVHAIDLIAKGLYLARGGTGAAYKVEGGEGSSVYGAGKVHRRINEVRGEAYRIITAWRKADPFASPAPDALRVAVESLEWAIAEIKGDTRYDNEDHREAALEKAQSTLAALQAEQKGGA